MINTEKKLDLRIQSTAELSRDWIALQKLKREKPELFGLKSTGIKDLDKALNGGIEAGQLVYIGGAPKSGKSTLMKKIAMTYGKAGLNYLFVSGEMTNMQMGTLIFSDQAGVDRGHIRSISLSSEEWIRLEEAAEDLSNTTGFWSYGLSTLTLLEKAMLEVEERSKQPIDAIFVDYIQLMEAKGKGTRVQEIEFISRGLKRFSIQREHPVAVFSASQLNRESIRSKLIDPQSFLGSGSLERDMDIGMILHSITDPIDGTTYDNRRRITIVGSRETDIGNVDVYYDGKLARIGDIATTESISLFDRYWNGENE